MNDKLFLERLEKALSAFGLSLDIDYRAAVLMQCSEVSFYTAKSILSGMMIPNNTIVEKISDYLGVSASWLLGLTDKQYGEAE